MASLGSDLFTVAQAAKRAQVSRWLLYSSIKAGSLKCYRIGSAQRSIRLCEEQLIEWLNRPVVLSMHVATAKEAKR